MSVLGFLKNFADLKDYADKHDLSITFEVSKLEEKVNVRFYSYVLEEFVSREFEVFDNIGTMIDLLEMDLKEKIIDSKTKAYLSEMQELGLDESDVTQTIFNIKNEVRSDTVA